MSEAKKFRMERNYRIKRHAESMEIVDGAGERIAEYAYGRAGVAGQLADIREMYASIDAHLSQPGETLDSYQW